MSRETAIQQKKQNDCEARLNAMGSPSDHMTNAFERLANADLCRANPDIKVEEAIAAQDRALEHLPPGYKLEQPARQPVCPKAIEGTITKDAVLYSESRPGGPGGQVPGKVESGTHARVIRLDSVYGNVQVKTPNGITGWLSSDEINY